MAEGYANVRKQHNPGKESKPEPNPETLYPDHLRAAMPEPSELLRSSLAVRLTRAEKDALDLLAAWPLCTTDQMAGLMGGVTRRRANQVLSSLAAHSLVRADGQRHVLTDDGLRYLARRDRAAVGPVVGRWSARKRRRRSSRAPVYAGTALRSSASQMEHHDAITGFAAALSAETARSRDYEVLDLMPTSRSAVGCRWDWTSYVVHPDASFQLAYREPVALLPPGVRAPGHDPQAGADPPGELPPLLQQRLAQPGPRWAAAPGPVRVPESRCRGGLPARCLRFPPPHPVHVQPPDPG